MLFKMTIYRSTNEVFMSVNHYWKMPEVHALHTAYRRVPLHVSDVGVCFNGNRTII